MSESPASPVTFKRKVAVSPILNADSVTTRTAGFANQLKTMAARQGYALPKGLAQEMVDEVVTCTANELLACRHVNLRDLGTFKLIVRTLRSGKKVVRVKFLTAPSLKSKLAERRH